MLVCFADICRADKYYFYSITSMLLIRLISEFSSYSLGVDIVNINECPDNPRIFKKKLYLKIFIIFDWSIANIIPIKDKHKQEQIDSLTRVAEILQV